MPFGSVERFFACRLELVADIWVLLLLDLHNGFLVRAGAEGTVKKDFAKGIETDSSTNNLTNEFTSKKFIIALFLDV